MVVLALAVVLAHVLGLEMMSRLGQGPGALELMADPDFNRALTLASSAPEGAAGGPLSADTPAPSTVGQVVQARTVWLPIPADVDASSNRPLVDPTAQDRNARVKEIQRPAARPVVTPAPTVPSQADTLARSDIPRPPEEVPSIPVPQAKETESAPMVVLDAPSTAIEKNETNPASAPIQQSLSAIVSEDEKSAWLSTWPVSTRLSYTLTGYYRGDFSGKARVQWLRNADRYQAQVDVNVALLLNMRMTSQGRITPTRLWPEAYEEVRRGKTRTARLGDQLLYLDNGNSLPRPPLLQDTASQFVQLSQDFALGRHKLQVGAVVPVMLARPGGVDEWVYDVVSVDTLSTRLGDVPAFHLKPRPLANPRGSIAVDMWFAPRLQHLPARIRLTLNEDTWLDLMLDSIEQSTPPT